MAGNGILANGVTEILKGLSILVAKEIGLARGVKDEFPKLKKTLDMILALMDDAEKKQMKYASVRVWLEELKEIAYDAEDILDEYAYEVLCQCEMTTRKRDRVSNFLSSNNNFMVSHHIGDEIIKINAKLNEHALQMLELGRNSGPMDLDESSSLRELRETDSMIDQSLKIIGRDKDKSNVMKMVLHNDGNNIQVIPIVGMGGLGKTTLAKQIFNNITKTDFELKMWVYVSEDFNVKKLFMKIIESITKKKCKDVSNIDVLVDQLQQLLSEKKYLLVLDDVWNKNSEKWENLRRPLQVGDNGSKIIVTTRSDDVASVMGGKPYSYKLEILGENESWSLFHERTFGCLGGPVETTTLTRIGKELVRKCEGLPLALIFLISLLRNKVEYEWKVINENKNWVQSYDDEDKIRVLPILKLSYDHLPSYLKQCFSYFSLFPKDYTFDRNTLILLWMAEGFLPQPSRGNNLSMEEYGNNCFNHLLDNSFFQDVYTDEFEQVSFSMHDLVHDLAKYVAGDRECLIWTADDQDMESILNVRRLKLFCGHEGHRCFDEIMAAFDKKSKLRTLIVFDKSIKKIEKNAFNGIKRLGVLDLHDAPELEEISSSSMSDLKHLRYLNLNGTQIKRLPESLWSLYHLQTLDLRGCKNLKELSKGIGKLINLRHLFLPDDIIMPREIGQLTSLQTLQRIDVGNSYTDKYGKIIRSGESTETGSGYGIEVLEGLNLLKGELTINHLRDVTSGTDAQLANLNRKKDLNKICLRWLTEYSGAREDDVDGGEFYNKEEAVLEALQPHPNLKELSIYQYSGAKLPQWMGDPSYLQNLVILSLVLFTCKQLVGLGQLPALKELGLYSMASLEEWVNDIPSPTVSSYSCFPCLEKIKIGRCPNLRKTPTCFPSLKELALVEINERVAVPLITTNLNSLESVTLENISELKFLPRRLLQGTNLKELYVSECRDFQGFDQKKKKKKKQLEEERFTSLKDLQLHSLPKLEFLPDIRSFTSLEHLEIEDCESLKILPEDLTYLSSSLEHLDIVEIYRLKEVDCFTWSK